MTTIAVASTKGGPGKTTISVNLADYWARAGKTVACVDLDPNANLARWLERGGMTGVSAQMCHDEDVVVSTVLDLARTYDVVVLDVPGFGARSMVYAVGVADFVLIPSKTGEDDVIEAIRTRGIVRQTSDLARREIPHGVVLTQADPRTRVYAHARKQFAAFDVPVLDLHMPARTVYQQSRFQGCSVFGMENKEAHLDIERIAQCIMEMVS